MPSPIGHALGAVAAGWMIAPPPRTSSRARVTQAVALAAIGAAPDLDLLVGSHRGVSHSLGAAIAAASFLAVVRYPVAMTRTRIWLAACAAWLTHPLLDALSEDSSAPFGVMAFWPFSSAHVILPWPVFSSIYRHWWERGFLQHNSAAIAREVLILAPLAALVWYVRVRLVTSRAAFDKVD